MRFVLDASVALAWFIKGSPEQAAYARSVAMTLADPETLCVVPALWHTEVGATLLKSRRNPAAKFSASKLKMALAELDQLSLETHSVAVTSAMVVGWGERFHVQGYDAHYFELAYRLGLPLATLDAGLIAACNTFNVQHFQPA